jgi:hypothetical protein
LVRSSFSSFTVPFSLHFFLIAVFYALLYVDGVVVVVVVVVVVDFVV